MGLSFVEAVNRAINAIEEKNPLLDNKEIVAEQVGIGAVIFHDLFTQRIKNVDFSWDKVLSFEGTTGPYVQYTYARARSILRKNSIEFDPSTMGYEWNEEECQQYQRHYPEKLGYQVLKPVKRVNP